MSEKTFTMSGLAETDVRRIGFLALETVFFGVIATVFSGRIVSIDLVSFLFLALATFRTARTLSFNEVGEPLRSAFTQVVPDSCGAGADVHPRGVGFRYVIGSLLSCPICTGTWAGLVLFTLWIVAPGIGKPLVYVLAIAGASEILHYSACLLEWLGRLARVMSGKVSPDKDA